MPDSPSIIEQVAAEPIEATVDGQTVKNHPLPDQIAADEYLAAKAASSGVNPRGGRKCALRRWMSGRVVPTGATEC